MARALDLVGYRHFEADMYFELFNVPFSRESLTKAHRWCQDSADNALSQGHRVVVANTFTRLWEMREYVLMADSLNASLRIICATGDYGSTHSVPADKIEAMRERWEPLPCAADELAAYFTVSAVR